MVYGKIFYNNIKEYTPTWMKTIPYSQVTKPVLGNISLVLMNNLFRKKTPNCL